MKLSRRRNAVYNCIISFTFTLLIMLILYKACGYAPFGKMSLASMDANIQYLDFFAYLKDVLTGKNDIGYSFGKALGGTNIAVYSYYLSSPLNLLVLFFEKADLHSFFDILVAIKFAMAATFFAVFLNVRFAEKRNGRKLCCLRKYSLEV